MMEYIEIARRVIARQRAERVEAVAEPVAVPSGPPDLNDYMAIFYERVAICEHDGGLDRIAAERLAMRQVLATFAEYGVSEWSIRRGLPDIPTARNATSGTGPIWPPRGSFWSSRIDTRNSWFRGRNVVRRGLINGTTDNVH